MHLNHSSNKTSIEDITDPNQIYSLKTQIKDFGIIEDDEVNRFVNIFYKGTLNESDREKLKMLVRNAVGRFEYKEDEKKQEEFRQLLKSYMRFYSFIAQVVRLEDNDLEKLFVYTSWLSKMLPSRTVPAEVEITEDMLLLKAFRIEEKQNEGATLKAGETKPLSAIKNFGAQPYTEDEEKALSEIVDNFNQRHGTEFTNADISNFRQVNQEILADENLREMLKNNPPDVVFETFSDAFFKGTIKLLQKNNQLQNIIMSDAEARDEATRFFFDRALVEIKNAS